MNTQASEKLKKDFDNIHSSVVLLGSMQDPEKIDAQLKKIAEESLQCPKAAFLTMHYLLVAKDRDLIDFLRGDETGKGRKLYLLLLRELLGQEEPLEDKFNILVRDLLMLSIGYCCMKSK